MTQYLLDACALIAVTNDEPCTDKVLDLIEQAKTGDIRIFISIVQLLEFYYDRIYVSGKHEARKHAETVLEDPITIIETISYPVMYDAGRFKTAYSMSLADAILCAVA